MEIPLQKGEVVTGNLSFFNHLVTWIAFLKFWSLWMYTIPNHSHPSGQFITTSAEGIYPNGGLVRESPPKMALD